MIDNNFFKNMVNSGDVTGLPESSNEIIKKLHQETQKILDSYNSSKVDLLFSFNNTLARKYVCYPLVVPYDRDDFNIAIGTNHLKKILNLSEEDRQAWIRLSCTPTHDILSYIIGFWELLNAYNVELKENLGAGSRGYAKILDSYGGTFVTGEERDRLMVEFEKNLAFEKTIDDVLSYLKNLENDILLYRASGQCI